MSGIKKHARSLPMVSWMLKNNFDSELKRSLSEVKTATLEDWLSATRPRAQKPAVPRFSMLQANLSHNHWPLNVTSRIAWTKNGVNCFNPTTIKATTALYRLPSSSTSAYSQVWYWVAFCKYIVSTIKMRSVEISTFSSKTFKAFNESGLPCCILSKVIWRALEVF